MDRGFGLACLSGVHCDTVKGISSVTNKQTNGNLRLWLTPMNIDTTQCKHQNSQKYSTFVENMFFLYFVEVGNFTVNRFGQNAMITVFDI